MSISWGEIGVSAFSVLASAGVSVYISKRTAKAEIEKLKAIWAHEKEAACDSDFDAMVAAVSLYDMQSIRLPQTFSPLPTPSAFIAQKPREKRRKRLTNSAV